MQIPAKFPLARVTNYTQRVFDVWSRTCSVQATVTELRKSVNSVLTKLAESIIAGNQYEWSRLEIPNSYIQVALEAVQLTKMRGQFALCKLDRKVSGIAIPNMVPIQNYLPSSFGTGQLKCCVAHLYRIGKITFEATKSEFNTKTNFSSGLTSTPSKITISSHHIVTPMKVSPTPRITTISTSAIESFQLWYSNKLSMLAISQQRNISVGTIAEHISYAMIAGYEYEWAQFNIPDAYVQGVVKSVELTKQNGERTLVSNSCVGGISMAQLGQLQFCMAHLYRLGELDFESKPFNSENDTPAKCIAKSNCSSGIIQPSQIAFSSNHIITPMKVSRTSRIATISSSAIQSFQLWYSNKLSIADISHQQSLGLKKNR
jgi:hypothetical protein